MVSAKLGEVMFTRIVYKALHPYLARLFPAADIVINPYISGKLIPLQATKAYSIITHRGSPAVRVSNGTLPVPPKELWEGYGDTETEYLSCGHQNMAWMLNT